MIVVLMTHWLLMMIVVEVLWETSIVSMNVSPSAVVSWGVLLLWVIIGIMVVMTILGRAITAEMLLLRMLMLWIAVLISISSLLETRMLRWLMLDSHTTSWCVP